MQEGEGDAPADRSGSRGKAKAPPAIARDDAQARMERAAKAAGLSIEELGGLLVDAGVTALPPSDGVTERYSLSDLGLRLWTEASSRPRSARAEWYAGLAEVQQKAVVVVLRDRGYSTEVIAREFDIDPFDINRVWAAYADKLGEQVVGLRLNTIAGQLQLAKERAQSEAMKRGDHNAYWRIEKEFTKQLQELGIVDRAIHRVEHTHRFDDQARAEIDAMLDLERKKLAHQEDLKAIEAEVFDEDPLPDSSLEE
jgi:hypothetical protein